MNSLLLFVAEHLAVLLRVAAAYSNLILMFGEHS